MKILLVYNPFAGHQRARKLLPQVESIFVEKNIAFDLALTDYPEHATEIIKQADFKNYDGIVAAGGDGTLFEVINGYFKNKSRTKIPLGVLPVGTGNAFARDLELDTSNWKKPLKLLPCRNQRWLTLVIVNHMDRNIIFLTFSVLVLWQM